MNARSVCQVCALVLLAANVALAAPVTYYVKNGGNDGLSGLSDTKAWATIAKVNTEFNNGTFKAGDSILLKCGSKWGEQLVITQSGDTTDGDFALAGGFWPGASGSTGGCVRDPEWQCDGDTDGDGQVNPVDSGLVQAAFGSTDETDLCQYDIDCDGQINPIDSGIVQSLFGTCNAPRAACP